MSHLLAFWFHIFHFDQNVIYMFFILYSYGEVRAEQRRELGIEESPPEITADKVRLLSNMSKFLLM